MKTKQNFHVLYEKKCLEEIPSDMYYMCAATEKIDPVFYRLTENDTYIRFRSIQRKEKKKHKRFVSVDCHKAGREQRNS